MPKIVIWIHLHRVHLCTAVSLCHRALVMLLVTLVICSQGSRHSRKLVIFLAYMRLLGTDKIFQKEKEAQTSVPSPDFNQNQLLRGELRL